MRQPPQGTPGLARLLLSILLAASLVGSGCGSGDSGSDAGGDGGPADATGDAGDRGEDGPPAGDAPGEDATGVDVLPFACGDTTCEGGQICVVRAGDCGGVALPDGGSCTPGTPTCEDLPDGCESGNEVCTCYDPCSAESSGCYYYEPGTIRCQRA